MKVELTKFETEFITNQIKIEIERIKENLYKISEGFFDMLNDVEGYQSDLESRLQVLLNLKIKLKNE